MLTKKVAAAGGKVVKTLGDGLVCQFGSAEAALRAACAMQAAAGQAAPRAQRLAIKVGFNFGPVVLKGSDVFGDTVNVCARLVGLAAPHQVLTTQETLDALPRTLQDITRPLYPLNVRGRVGEVKVCEVLWRADPDVTQAMTRSDLIITAAQRDSILKVTYSGETVVVELTGAIKIGRDKTNDLVVPSNKASRVHARIFGRSGHFVIADQSSNGTYVAIDGNTRELTLRREEAVLGERGYIGLGGAASGNGDHILRFRLENRKR